LTVSGAVFPQFFPDKGEIWHGGAHHPLPRAKLYLYRRNVSPLQGEKNIFGPLSKRHTGRHAALRTGLPVISLFLRNLVGDG